MLSGSGVIVVWLRDMWYFCPTANVEPKRHWSRQQPCSKATNHHRWRRYQMNKTLLKQPALKLQWCHHTQSSLSAPALKKQPAQNAAAVIVVWLRGMLRFCPTANVNLLEPAQCHRCHACHAKCRSMSGSATPATPTAPATTGQLGTKRATKASPVPLVPRLPRKVRVHVTKRHPCHAKRKQMLPSATPATQSAGPCRQVPRLLRQQPRRQQRQLGTKRATKASPVPLVPRLPRKVKVDVAKHHGCHANSRSDNGVNWESSASPEPA